MRKLHILLALGLFSVSLGCRHVGGKCDQCSANLGDASLYAPFTANRTPMAPHPVPPAVSSDPGSFKKDIPPMSEIIGSPLEMPKK
jgi:hypothetical protein